MLMMMVVMLMVVTAAAVIIMLMVMVVMLMVVTATAVIIMLMVMVVMLMHQLLFQVMLMLHRLQQLGTGQLTPRGGNQGSLCIMLTKKSNSCIQLSLGNGIRPGQDDHIGGFHLIVIEFAKILHIHLDLAGIHNCDSIAQGHILVGHLFHGSDHIGQLANAGGFDHDPIRVILCDHLGQSLTKVAH